ncbi:MAG: two-component regulator propeller domain-containing protein [Bacteroidota bacterium]
MTVRILLVLFVVNCPLLLKAGDVTFKHLTVEDGLSQNTINCIFQDHAGIIWLGTQDGLNCYDGYRLKTYRHDPSDPSSLSHNWIWDVIEDDSLNLWIATWEGLTKFDRRADRFMRYLPDSSDQNAISGTRPASLVTGPQGQLWIGTWGGGLNRYDPAKGTFTQFRNLADSGKHYPGDFIRELFMDRQGAVWIGTWNGLWRCSADHGNAASFEQYSHHPEQPGSVSSNRITALEEDPHGNIWIGTLGGGLNRYNRHNNQFVRFLYDENDPRSISSNDITSIENDGKGGLWIGTVSDGLNRFDPVTGKFMRFKNNPERPGSIATDAVFSVFKDRGGVLWVGAGGINTYSRKFQRFDPTPPFNNLKAACAGKNIRAICEEREGIIWIGTRNNGLLRFNPENGKWVWYRHQPGNPNSLSQNEVTSITSGRNGLIWIGTSGGGLNSLDPRTGVFCRYNEQDALPATWGLNRISGIVADEQGTIWIATLDRGLIAFYPGRERYRAFRSDQSDPSTLSGNYLFRIFQDSRGDLWIGSWGGGLNRFDREEGRFTRFMHNPDDPSSLPGNIIHSIHEQVGDSSRLIWIGTASGFASLDPEWPDSGFTHFPASSHLPSQSVYGTLFDSKGNLWISSNAGISRFDRGEGSVKHFNIRDGLPGNEFNGGAFLELSQGLFAFGGIAGLLLFHPDSIGESDFQPEIALTSFSLFNEILYEGVSLCAQESITLSYDQNFFSFEFASTDYSDPQKNRFRYQLEGIDREWRLSGDRHYASYTKIAPGHYRFRVQGTNSDGIWSDREAEIGLIITPPFWQRWWFRGMILSVLLMLVFSIHLYRIRKVKDIERLRTRIASDLHDDIGSALSRISVYSQQILTLQERSRIRDASGRISALSREVIATMGDIVWSIDARNDSTADLLSRMQELTHNLLSESDIRVSFTHEGMNQRKPLRVQVRQNLYYIFKEALNNIVKHAEADHVDISVINSDSAFSMVIADNGNGYDPVLIRRGNGIGNMEMRAARIGATLNLSNGESGSGVEIRLNMKRL